jgi:hypothetical protein
MMTVVPEGGLCNRLRVLASASVLAQATGQQMRAHWYRTPDFNCRFDALFAIVDLPFQVIEGGAMSKPAKALTRWHDLRAALGGTPRLGPRETAPGAFDFDAMAPRLRRGDVFIRSNSCLVSRPRMFQAFKPVGDAASRISGIRARLARSVGVHVRRTDNDKASAFSTLERFVELMHAELLSNADTEFFVATDDPEAIRALRQEFGQRVWEYPKRAYARDEPMSLVDAVVDLYGLGSSRKLIGSYWSSFTDTAAALNDIECVIARTGNH